MDIIPERFQFLFPFADGFNRMQLTVAKDLFETDRNVVICAPSGSGKNTALLLAIIRQLTLPSLFLPPRKPAVVYLSPFAWRCQHFYDELNEKFRALGYSVGLLAGGSNSQPSSEILDSCDIIFATPEKWDLLSTTFPQQCLGTGGLVLLDQIHSVANEDRGPHLEILVARMKIFGGKARFVAVTSIAANVADIGDWLDGDLNSKEKAAVYFFGKEFRPVPLKKMVKAYRSNGNYFDFDDGLNRRLPGICKAYSKGGPILVICLGKQRAEDTAIELSGKLNFGPKSEAKMEELRRETRRMVRPGLQQLILGRCAAFHHADVPENDKKVVEKLFRNGKLSLICSTTTLSNCLKIPAQMVIIKTTQHVGPREFSDVTFLEMLERAGRRGLDKEGVVVVMTRKETEQRYQSLDYGHGTATSTLNEQKAIAYLKSEIEVGFIDTPAVAVNWLWSLLYAVGRKSIYMAWVENVIRQLTSTGAFNNNNAFTYDNDNADVIIEASRKRKLSDESLEDAKPSTSQAVQW